jgi:hypothetical protein
MQAFVLPLLYRRIWIRDHYCLWRFAEALQLAELGDKHVGNFVRVLDMVAVNVESEDEDDSTQAKYLDCLTMILFYTKLLTGLVLPPGTNRTCLALVSGNCAPTLTTLTLFDVTDPANVFLFVGQLQNLTRLHIKLTARLVSLPVAGWVMPKLRRLKWEVGHRMDRRDSEFLVKCQFDSMLSLCLRFQSLEHPSQAESLKAFLARHSFVPELRLSVKKTEIAHLLLPVTHCSTLVLQTSPASDLAAFLPPSVRFLELRTALDGENIGLVLDGILARPRTLEKVRLKLTPDLSVKFVWREGNFSHKLAMFTATMLPYAARLKAHGILLLDERRETLDIWSA